MKITNYSLIRWTHAAPDLIQVNPGTPVHQLMKDYREKKKVLLNIEHRIMQRIAMDYEHLCS